MVFPLNRKSVGAINDRPQILHRQNLSLQSENNLFPFGKPENPKDFRRAINDRPYKITDTISPTP